MANNIETLISQCVQALQIVLHPQSSPNQRAEAQKFCDNLHDHSESHDIGFRLLLTSNESSGKHFGCQLIVSSVRRRWNSWPPEAKVTCKNVMLDLSPVANAQDYVKRKFADAIVEVARREWPQQWPEFLPTLLKSGQNELVLLIIRTLADAVAEEQKDLPSNRRKEVVKALTELKNEVFNFFTSTMSASTPSESLKREGVLFIRSISSIYGLKDILMAEFDTFMRAQLANDSLREEALMTFDEWASIKFFKRNAEPRKEPFERLVRYFAEMGSYAKYTPDCDYTLHRHIANILKDLVTYNAECIHSFTVETQGALWRTLMDLTLYPSVFIAYESIFAMIKMIRPLTSLDQAPYVKLEDIWMMCFIRQYKYTGGPISPFFEKIMPSNARAWMEALEETWKGDMDVWASQEHQTTTGLTKMACGSLLKTLCEVGGAPYYIAHVRHAEATLDVLLQEPQTDHHAIDAAFLTVERLGPELVTQLHNKLEKYNKTKANKVEKKKDKAKNDVAPADYTPILDSALKFLEKVMMVDFMGSVTDFSGEEPKWLLLEQRRLEFIQTSSVFLKHKPEVVPPVVQFLFSRIERDLSPHKGTAVTNLYALVRNALTVLIHVCKEGEQSVTAHLDALLAKAQQVFPRLGENNKDLLVQSMIAAATADFDKQGKVIELVLIQDVQKWVGPEMTELVKSGQKMETLFTASQTPTGAVTGVGDQCFLRIYPQARKFWCLMNSFSMAIQNSVAQTSGTTDFVVKRHAAWKLIEAITPNLLQAVETFNTYFASDWLAQNDPPLKNFLQALDESQWCAVLGTTKTESGLSSFDVFPYASKEVKEGRSWMYALRSMLYKVLGQCMLASDGFWSIPDVLEKMQRIVQTFQVSDPYHVVLFHRSVFNPFFSVKGGTTVQHAWMQKVASSLLPTLCDQTLKVCAKYKDALETKNPMFTRYPVTIQGILAQMTVSLYQQLGSFCSNICLGPKGKFVPMQVLDARKTYPKDEAAREAMKKATQGENKKINHPGAGEKMDCWLDCIVMNEALRTTIRQTAFSVSRFPDATACAKAVHSFKVLGAQTWTLGVLKYGWREQQNTGNQTIPTGRDIIADALQKLDDYGTSYFRPLLEILTSPATLKEDSPFYSILQKTWSDYQSDQQIVGKINAAPQICEIAHAVHIGLMATIRLYQLQLEVLQLTAEGNLNICQPLLQAINLLCLLPNTSRGDVEQLIEALLNDKTEQDDAKAMVKNLLRAALPERQTIRKTAGDVLDIPTLEMDMEQCAEECGEVDIF